MPHTILIDARLSGLKHAGIGRYTQNLIKELAQIDSKNRYHLLLQQASQFSSLPDNFQITLAPIRHYTLAEQIKLPSLVKSIKPDLVHFPHFNVPLFCPRPFVVTIHDLLWHEKIGLNATTLPPLKYLLKYTGYRLTVNQAVSRSRHIFVPTNQVKQNLTNRFPNAAQKISVTPEAASSVYFSKSSAKASSVLKKLNVTPPFIVYTGSLYPHKNVNTLIQSLVYHNLPLVIVSARNIFQKKTQSFVNDQGLSKKVKFAGFLPDEELRDLYSQALCLVQPSLSEGFGLTGLEAMAAGLPVICSHHSTLAEVYSQAALFTDTKNPKSLAQTIINLQKDSKLQTHLSQLGRKQANLFSWKHLALQTHQVYDQVLSS